MPNINGYRRIIQNQVPIYIKSEQPDWFIPSPQADHFLCLYKQSDTLSQAIHTYRDLYQDENIDYKVGQLLSHLSIKKTENYQGRIHYRSPDSLKECWFHLTNRCNMDCGYCMFENYRIKDKELTKEQLFKVIKELYQLGVRIFYFTGGEPLVYPYFREVIEKILSLPHTHAIILSNGKTVSHFSSWLNTISKKRIHFQISVDGNQKIHDAFRGKGAYAKLKKNLINLLQIGFPVTLAMCVNRSNLKEMVSLVQIAGQLEVKNVHYLWLFLKGRAKEEKVIKNELIFYELIKAYKLAQEKNIFIDNIEIIKSQIFSLPGTRFDLSNAGWESLAISPEGHIYPSPALIYEKELNAGHISEGIKNVWLKSPVFEKIRKTSLIDNDLEQGDAMRFLIGGGDIDHSYIAGKHFVGHDPYRKLYPQVALYLLSQEVQKYPCEDIGIICRMGDRLYRCEATDSPVQFTHSNCVLSLPDKDNYYLVKSFYSLAAEKVNKDIINPVHYEETQVAHIPIKCRKRSYGCGSPVLDCELSKGEVLVDLGSGSGLECFIAARKVGESGKVYGIDMSKTMLDLAREGQIEVVKNIGFNNMEFLHGFLEDIPLVDAVADVVISNCVISLSPDKRKTFAEIMRILKPGGRLFISDIVSDESIPLDIQYNEKLRGECIGGAMQEKYLFYMLENLGFQMIHLKKRFPYRTVKGYTFYTVTYSAYKKGKEKKKNVVYRGPFKAVVADDGKIIYRGIKTEIHSGIDKNLDGTFFELNENGAVINIDQEINCCCGIAPEVTINHKKIEDIKRTKKISQDCMVCGAKLQYLEKSIQQSCYFCSRKLWTNTICTNEHFVCDNCHSQDALDFIKNFCLNVRDKDMIALFKKIRAHPSISMHGPEYHSLVPAVILTVYGNLSGQNTAQLILEAIHRGKTISGGACSFLGICGAAIGVGIALSLLLKANPYKARERQIVQKVTHQVLKKISRYHAPRCCQRDCWLALKAASQILPKYLNIELAAEEKLICEQFSQNKECIGKLCPLFPGHQ